MSLHTRPGHSPELLHIIILMSVICYYWCAHQHAFYYFTRLCYHYISQKFDMVSSTWNHYQIGWATAVSHKTAGPHRSYHLLCMLEWSLSDHRCVCINLTARNLNIWLKKFEDISNFINICRKNSFQVLNLHGFLRRFWLCHSNEIFIINEKNRFRYRDSLRRKHLGIKHVKNHLLHHTHHYDNHYQSRHCLRR